MANGDYVTYGVPGDQRRPAPHTRSRPRTPRAAPGLGEHTREVLAEIAGLQAAEIDGLIAAGAVS